MELRDTLCALAGTVVPITHCVPAEPTLPDVLLKALTLQPTWLAGWEFIVVQAQSLVGSMANLSL